MCIQAKQYTCLTSYYYLLTKKMQLAGEIFDKAPTRDELEKLQPVG